MAIVKEVKTLTFGDTQYVVVDAEAREKIAELMACNINPTAKTDSMTQPVGVDSEGKLWTEPSAGEGGLTAEQISALDGMFKIAAYTEDATAAYSAFRTAFGIVDDEPTVPDEPDIVTYSVITELVNANLNNSTTSVTEGTSYTATLAAADGYTLDGATVTVTMGGADITSTVYADGVISISSVTGNVEIVASAVEIESEDTSGELITDGMLAYFDFRSAEYNNAGAGGSTTISPTQGNGQLYAWANNCIEVQDNYGIHCANSRTYAYDQSGGTTQTDIGSPMTIIVLTKGHVANQGFLYANTEVEWGFKPKYNNVIGSTTELAIQNGSQFNSDSKYDYNFCAYRVDGDILTEVMDTSVATYDGKDYDDFASWTTTATIGAQNQADDGIYITAAAIYNRALSDVEIEEMKAFMKTLEVA